MIYPSNSYTYYQSFSVGGGAGGEWIWTVPADVTQIEVEMYGGKGGNGGNDSSKIGGGAGNGTALTGFIPVTPGQNIIISTGGNGGAGASSASNAAGGAGGYSSLGYSGGAGGNSGTTGSSGGGGGGGGATVIRVGSIDYVAGGGGGGGGAGLSGDGSGGNNLSLVSTIYGGAGQTKSGDGGGGGGGGGGVQGGAGGLTRTGDSPAFGGNLGSSSTSLTLSGGAASDGMVFLAAFGSASALTINSGTPSYTTVNSLNGWGSIVVGGTGTFQPALNVTGYNYSTRAPRLMLNAGGTFQSNNGFNTFDDVTLNGGVVRARGGMNSIFPSFMFRGTVTVTADSTIYHEPTGYNSYTGLMIGSNSTVKSTTFNVYSGKSLDIQTLVKDGSWGSGTPTEATKLIKTGTGTLKLNYSNTYSGGTDISDGKVEVGNSGALGTNTVTMTGGILSSASTNSYIINNPFNFNGIVTLGDSTTNGSLSLAGITTAAANTTLELKSPVTFSDLRLSSTSITVNNPATSVSIQKLTLQPTLSQVVLNNTTITLSKVVVTSNFSAGSTKFLSVVKSQNKPAISLDSVSGLNSNQVAILEDASETDPVKLNDVLIEGNVSFDVQTPMYLGSEYASNNIFSIFSYTGTLSGLSNLQVIPPPGYTLTSVTNDTVNKQVLVDLTSPNSIRPITRYNYSLAVKNT